MDTSLKKYFTTLILSIFIFSFQFDNENCIFIVDTVVQNNTLKMVKKKLAQSEVSEKKIISKIFCEYVAYFDTLDLKKDFNEESLVNHFKLATDSLLINNTKTFYYNCRCDVYDTTSKKVASIDSGQDFYVFPVFTGKFSIQDYLKIRYEVLNDQFVFRPSSKRHTFNYDWHMAINEGGSIVWFNINEPKKNYTTKEVREKYWNEFIIN